VSVLGGAGGRMAAGDRSVACYAAALLAAAVLLSAPATTGPALPTLSVSFLLLCREPVSEVVRSMPGRSPAWSDGAR
jgi:hypothetical protein